MGSDDLNRRRLKLLTRLLINHGATPEVPLEEIADLDEDMAGRLAQIEGDRLALLARIDGESHRLVPAAEPTPRPFEPKPPRPPALPARPDGTDA